MICIWHRISDKVPAGNGALWLEAGIELFRRDLVSSSFNCSPSNSFNAASSFRSSSCARRLASSSSSCFCFSADVSPIDPSFPTSAVEHLATLAGSSSVATGLWLVGATVPGCVAQGWETKPIRSEATFWQSWHPNRKELGRSDVGRLSRYSPAHRYLFLRFSVRVQTALLIGQSTVLLGESENQIGYAPPSDSYEICIVYVKIKREWFYGFDGLWSESYETCTVYVKIKWDSYYGLDGIHLTKYEVNNMRSAPLMLNQTGFIYGLDGYIWQSVWQ